MSLNVREEVMCMTTMTKGIFCMVRINPLNCNGKQTGSQYIKILSEHKKLSEHKYQLHYILCILASENSFILCQLIFEQFL